jgi:hypothetical protein
MTDPDLATVLASVSESDSEIPSESESEIPPSEPPRPTAWVNAILSGPQAGQPLSGNVQAVRQVVKFYKDGMWWEEKEHELGID